jgi:hypothetical protein
VSQTQCRLELVADQPGELAAVLGRGDSALLTDGDLEASRRHFEEAYRLAERAADGPAMARATLGLAGLWVQEQRTVTGAVQLEARLQHVLELLDPCSSLALRIRARLAGEADYFRGQHATILAVLAEALTPPTPRPRRPSSDRVSRPRRRALRRRGRPGRAAGPGAAGS